jgi:hypothetical protein
MNMVTKNAQTQATAALSVGVNDEDGDQSPDRVQRDPTRLPERDRFALGQVVAIGVDQDEEHQRQSEQQSWNDAADEQMRDRDRAACRQRVDHHVVRRRDQQRLQRARNRHVDRE